MIEHSKICLCTISYNLTCFLNKMSEGTSHCGCQLRASPTKYCCLSEHGDPIVKTLVSNKFAVHQLIDPNLLVWEMTVL